jgi:hypothetical protein
MSKAQSQIQELPKKVQKSLDFKMTSEDQGKQADVEMEGASQ